ncbi:glycoside hydrolase family 127 protein [Croceibacterium sp. TMG7-5b_MA50]|uniref:glycoside hydrolase family 127 protein n=1 Tax=Croceibacterium sp. TMG7-5b_MA50 TaxID=3121290 RepID=UPI0032213BC9
MDVTRRALLRGASTVALVLGSAELTLAAMAQPAPSGRRRVEPVPMRHVRLSRSPFADAFRANRDYLLALDPERLLHNFYLSAGLPARGPVYGGWEAMGIAGHTLGHWLSACALTVAGSGDAAIAARLDHALAEMARIQAAHGDGYLGGTTVERDGETVDGKLVFEEVRRGDIRSSGFDLNGGWVPLYTWHKVHAGLIDAHVLAGNPRAMPIMLALAGYLAGVLEPLSEEQLQRVLHAEHGGLNETYAETYALTGDARWLRLAERLRHRAVLDPLTAQQDRLQGLHANTQIPKVIGLARLHELTGDPSHAATARFFHDTVTQHHSYVIGGNSEREHFGAPDQLAGRITEATCEACNSYNMLKLTRHLYSWEPDARWFDFYERVQLNHIMAHQRPADGRFAYFMPLAAGARRVWSSPEDSFWCCVGSGMESHAKHGDSIWWADDATLYLNLFISSELDWPERELRVNLITIMPTEGHAIVAVDRTPRIGQSLAVRLPGWADGATLKLNGAPASYASRNGYAVLDRPVQAGDQIEVVLPMRLQAEPLPDDPALVAFRHGPLVLGADLGPAAEEFRGIAPALVVDGAPTAALTPLARGRRYAARGAMGEPLGFAPFFAQHDRRAAVYLRTFTPAGWETAREDYVRSAKEAYALAARTVDVLYLGEMQPERDHAFAAEASEVVNWSGRSARRLRPGQSFTAMLARRPGPAVLRLMVTEADRERPMIVSVNGQALERGEPTGVTAGNLVAVDYLVPSAGEQGRDRAEVSVTAERADAVIYEMRMMSATTAAE